MAEAFQGRLRRGRVRTLRERDSLFGLSLISPTLIVVLVVVVAPIVWTLLLAFQRVSLIDVDHAGVLGDYTLRNFVAILSSPGFWDSLRVTLIYSVAGTVLSIALGILAALCVRRPFRGRAFVRASMLLPYVAPVVAVTTVWSIMLNPQYGIINHWGTELLGWDNPIPFLSQFRGTFSVLGLEVTVPTALGTVIAFESWRYFPFAFLFVLARMQAMPPALEEAARADGATPLQRFRHVILPQLGPVIAMLVILRFIMIFNKFDDVYLLTGGAAGTEVVAVRVFDFLAARADVSAAAAQAVILAVVLMICIAVYLCLARRKMEGGEP